MKAKWCCRYCWWWVRRRPPDTQWQHLRSTVEFVIVAATTNIAAADCCWHIIHSTHNSATNFSRSTHGIWSVSDDLRPNVYTRYTWIFFWCCMRAVRFFRAECEILPDRHFHGRSRRLWQDVRLRICPVMWDPIGFHPWSGSPDDQKRQCNRNIVAARPFEVAVWRCLVLPGDNSTPKWSQFLLFNKHAFA